MAIPIRIGVDTMGDLDEETASVLRRKKRATLATSAHVSLIFSCPRLGWSLLCHVDFAPQLCANDVGQASGDCFASPLMCSPMGSVLQFGTHISRREPSFEMSWHGASCRRHPKSTDLFIQTLHPQAAEDAHPCVAMSVSSRSR